MIVNELTRVFLHKENGQEIRLADPGAEFSTNDVQNFYSATYPILTNAKIIGPEIKDDEVQYRFESTMGHKGWAMKKQQQERTIKIRKESEAWKLQQHFGALTDRLNRLPDANEVQRNPLRSAPAGLTEMVF